MNDIYGDPLKKEVHWTVSVFSFDGHPKVTRPPSDGVFVHRSMSFFFFFHLIPFVFVRIEGSLLEGTKDLAQPSSPTFPDPRPCSHVCV